MKQTLTLLSFLLAVILGRAQDDGAGVPFVAYWSIGDSYNFNVTKIKQKLREGSEMESDTTSYIGNFEVIDSTDTSYKIKWSLEANLTSVEIPEEMMNELSKYLFTEVIYETTELGEFVAIENWQEIALKMKDLFAILLSKYETSDKDIAEMMQPVLGIYETREGIEQLIFKELMLFHFLFGYEYDPNEPLEYADELPNMFGGKPIRGETKIYVDAVDYEEGYCLMVQEMAINGDDTKRVITDIFKKMAGDEKEMKKAMKNARFEISDYNIFEFYYYPGIPLKIHTKRETILDIKGQKGSQVDMTIIELVD